MRNAEYLAAEILRMRRNCGNSSAVNAEIVPLYMRKYFSNKCENDAERGEMSRGNPQDADNLQK